MCDEAGFPSDDLEQKADLIRKHWGSVFAEKHSDPIAVGTLLSYAPAARGLPDLPPSIDDIAEDLHSRPDSAPGPDGIPYKAWQRLGDLGCDVLFAAALALQDPQTLECLPEDFNESFFMLPAQEALGHS